ncbi:MAG: DoxX family protein [Paludisphaera borealis]|uniref:DoxX family protein n=1 Tax=Paludisphaera borealis TaxID=1387353 RepID=UPI00284BA1CE|nr:DoxX family protein [Paludisphaera borealis]MDR3621924.1 DoxX family protein [Paludisphaera borealis]
MLRIAIGWHFLTEGLEKYDSTLHGTQPFSAEIYLRNANGPFAPYFRGMLPDVNGLALLDPDRLKAGWAAEVERIGRHYDFDEEQEIRAKKLLEESETWADYWFNNHDNDELRRKYYRDLAAVQAVERNPKAMSFERERAWEGRRTVDVDRRTVTGPLVARGKQLEEWVVGIATAEQKNALLSRFDYGFIKSALAPLGLDDDFDAWRVRRATYHPPSTTLDFANSLTMYGLILMGACLILGLFTRFSSLCAAAFLAMIYLSMPPWPGTPPNPKAEGHYWIVNKNLIELIACLLIASTASGHWFGLDALFFGARRRRRLARRFGLIDDSDAASSTKTKRDVLTV